MSAEVLAQTPTPFEHAGQTYQLGVADYELELYLQARHEAWARNRIEATAAQVGGAAYRTDCEVFASRRDGNLFAFGTPLSLTWLLSDEGMSEYLVLITQKGQKEQRGAAFTKDGLRQMRRQDAPAWERLVRLVVGRDFPNVSLPAPRAPATPPDTTNGSSSSCPGDPSSRTEEKSSPCPANTSSP